MKYPALFIEYFQQLSLRLTSMRKAVLFVLWSAHKPLKAYDIVESLMTIKPNMTSASVYRALDFFMSHGLLHKIESIQSYALCSAPEKKWPSELLMVCHLCHRIIEVYDADLRQLLTRITAEFAFRLNQDSIELHGLCAGCH